MRWLPVVTCVLAGCQTTLDPNYALQLESYRLTISSQQAVEVAKARAEEARYNALAAIGERSDGPAKQMAILALALARGGVEASHTHVPAVPNVPESQEVRAFKWAALFVGPAMSLAQGYFGYKLGVQQTRSTADSTIASYNALGATAVAGFGATQGIANSGFNTASSIANSGFGATQGIAAAAFAANTRPNVTLTNTGGVMGSGSYVGPNSGQNSGNSGRITSPDDLRNCSVTDQATGGC